jgi:hypothetical protein
MTTDELSIPDRVYFGVKALPGWYDVLTDAEDAYPPLPKRVIGSLISSVLLAGGEELEPIAIAGELNRDDYSGRLIVFYPTMIITVDAKQLNSERGSHETRIWPVDLVSGLALEAHHSFYDGTAERPRHTKFAFEFDLGGDRLRAASVAQHFQSPLVQEAAIFDAFKTIRDHLTRQ